ncbi:Charged multivesicular body protein 6 [Grifola frondosa]|uniref:Charged multivesicular body protein 6 n=1 Tax=Grifola frondosa TaxID=5627 RepID=A0A1C7MRU9_GRIFR|nr:Charged multivesicular body protein 6 [Grifola frondosa]
MGGNQSVPKITAQDRAILDLKLQRDKIRQYQKKIQSVLEREHEIAKQQLAAEGLLLKTDGQLENLEKLVSTIEFSLIEVSVLHGLKQGNEVLKEIHKEMNLETVEKLLEETQEAREYQREIDEMLANTLTLEEEESVQAELKTLQREAIGVEHPEPSIKLPSVPTTEPVVAVPEEPPSVPEEREHIPIAA